MESELHLWYCMCSHALAAMIYLWFCLVADTGTYAWLMQGYNAAMNFKATLELLEEMKGENTEPSTQVLREAVAAADANGDFLSVVRFCDEMVNLEKQPQGNRFPPQHTHPCAPHGLVLSTSKTLLGSEH